MAIIRTVYTAFILAIIMLGGTLYAQTPSWGWTLNLGGTGRISPGSVAADAAGNMYVTGSFTGQLPFGSQTMAGGEAYTVYIAKYGGGAWQWARRVQPSGDGNAYANDVTLDPDGNIYFLCATTSSSYIISTSAGDSTIHGPGSNNIIIGSYAPDGRLRWVRTIGTEEYRWGTSLVATSTALHITGQFGTTMSIEEQTITGESEGNIFLASFKLDGSLRQLTSIGNSTGSNKGIDLAVDNAERLYLLGSTSGEVMIGTTSVPATKGKILLACFGKEGELQWAVQDGGTQSSGNFLAVDRSGNCYITGPFRGTGAMFGTVTLPKAREADAFLARYDAAGKAQWAHEISGSQMEEPEPVGTDAAGNVYLCNFSQLLVKGQIVVSMYRPDGNKEWEQAVPGNLRISGLTVAGSNDLYVYGHYWDSARFGGTLLEHKDKTSNGLFIAHLGAGAGVEEMADGTGMVALDPIVPNPASGALSLRFSLRATRHATLRIVDLSGSEVAVIADGIFPAGESSVMADLSNLPVGTYVAILRSGTAVVSRRLVVTH